MKRADIAVRKPRIFGLDQGGFNTDRYVGVSILVSNTVKVTLSPSDKPPEEEKSSYTWTSDTITLFMKSIALRLLSSKQVEEEEAHSKHKGRTVYFYLMYPVEPLDPSQ